MKRVLIVFLSMAMLIIMTSCGIGSSDPKTVSCGVDFDVPEGFKVSEDNEALWLSPTYPDDTSNINVYTSASEASFAFLSREVIESTIEKSYKDQYGIDVECNITSFEKTKIDGYSAIICEYRYTVNGIALYQLQYMINADEQYTVTYTATAGSSWEEAFAASGKTIKVLTK